MSLAVYNVNTITMTTPLIQCIHSVHTMYTMYNKQLLSSQFSTL